MNIYDITKQWLEVQELIESGDIEKEALFDTLEAIEGDLEYKAESYAKIIKNLEKDINGIKEEEKRLSEKRKSLENNIKKMKNILEESMKVTGKTKFKTELFSFNIQKNTPSLIIDNEDSVPEEFINIVKSVNKSLIKDRIKSGEVFDFAHLESSESLRIK